MWIENIVSYSTFSASSIAFLTRRDMVSQYTNIRAAEWLSLYKLGTILSVHISNTMLALTLMKLSFQKGSVKSDTNEKGIFNWIESKAFVSLEKRVSNLARVRNQAEDPRVVDRGNSTGSQTYAFYDGTS